MSETPKQEYIRLLMDLDGYDMAEVSWGQQKTIMKQSKKLRQQDKELTRQERVVDAARECVEQDQKIRKWPYLSSDEAYPLDKELQKHGALMLKLKEELEQFPEGE